MSDQHPGYHSFVIGDKTFNVKDRYVDLKLIGTGAQGAVVSATDTVTGGKVAIKKFLSPFANEIYAKRAYREFFYMRLVHHKNIIRILHAFTPQEKWEDFEEIYLVMELMTASLNRLTGNNLSHDHLSYLTYQLLCGIKHLHMGGIIHRDLKPSNIVVDGKCNLKILDFGLARSFQDYSNSKMTRYVITSFCGIDNFLCSCNTLGFIYETARWWMCTTPVITTFHKRGRVLYVVVDNDTYYRAPEVILCSGYTDKVDMWSVGCILAELIRNRVLFRGGDQMDQWLKIVAKLGPPSEEFLSRLSDNVVSFIRKEERRGLPGLPWSEIFPNSLFPPTSTTSPNLNTENAIDLLSKLLCMDPVYRISVSEALRHRYLNLWFNEEEVNGATPTEFDQSVDNWELSVAEWRKRLFSELTVFQKQTVDYTLSQN